MSEIVPEAPKPEPVIDHREALVARVAALWIWTVFFGINGGLTYSFLGGEGSWSRFLMAAMGNPSYGSIYGGFPYQRGGGPGNVFALEMMSWIQVGTHTLGILASVAAWLFLYLFFASWVVPAVLIGSPLPLEPPRRRRAALYLSRTYQLLILAALARFAPEVLALVIPLLARLGVL